MWADVHTKAFFSKESVETFRLGTITPREAGRFFAADVGSFAGHFGSWYEHIGENEVQPPLLHGDEMGWPVSGRSH